MTIKELSQLYWLNREIELDTQRLEELQRSAEAPRSPQSHRAAGWRGQLQRAGAGGGGDRGPAGRH
ncbi:MAG: hypothetical protein LUF28_09195 [Clostridiales bacterium]|nr:hypothetical protein [Clostridiales bacterium]